MKLKELIELIDDRHLDVVVYEPETKVPIITINNTILYHKYMKTFKRLFDAEIIDIFDVSTVNSAKHGAISVTVDLPEVIYE